MTVVPVVLSITTGVCLFAGAIHLLFGLSRRPRDWVHITFALTSLAVAANALGVLAIHTSGSVDAYAVAHKYAFGPAGLGSIVGVLWFVAFYTGVKPRRFLLAMTLWITAIAVLQVVLPYGILFAEINGLRQITMPWGEQFVVAQATSYPWRWVVDLYFLVFFGFVLYATYRQFRDGDRGRAWLLVLVVALLFATNLFDTLVDTGVVNSIYIVELGYLGVVITMSARLYSEIIQMEAELDRHRGQLETLVQERTSELATANEQLEREIGERRLAEESLQQRLEELAVLGRITQMLVTVTDLSSALEQVCEAITHLFDAQATYVVLPSTEEPQLQVLVGFDHESGPVKAVPLPVSLRETPYFSRVLNQAETLTLSDVQALPIADPMRNLIARQRIQNTMLVPLVVRGASIGLLAIATDRADLVFTSDQVHLAETIAGDIAASIENARLFEQAQAAAVTEERSRLARELHDAATQTIYAATLIAESLPKVWARSPEEGQRNLVKLRQLVRGGLAEMRTLLFELRPRALEAADLGTLLQYLSDALTARTSIPIQVDTESVDPGEPGLSSEVKVALYRIAQEALNNVAKHSSATEGSVVLGWEPELARLTIQDNGRSFDPASVPADRMGLSIMAERAAEIGAELAIESSPGQGTRITVVQRLSPQLSAGDTP
jgi:signal transduction histidine kinase